MKKKYVAPLMQVVEIRTTKVLVGSPRMNDAVQANPDYNVL